MQNVDSGCKSDSVNRAICASVVIGNDFEDAAPAEALHRLRSRMLLSELRIVDRLPHRVAEQLWEMP